MNVLITAIGSMSSGTVIAALKEIFGINIVGCDIYPKKWLPMSYDVDCFYQVPKAIETDYIPQLIEICKEHNINFLFPLTDAEIDVLVHHSQEFKNIDTTLCISNSDAINISRNKQKLYEFFNDSALIKPIHTYTYQQLSESLFRKPMVAKIINGRSSEGLQIIQEWGELKYRNFSNYIFQPYIKGDIFTVDYIRDSIGNSFSIPRKELLRTVNGAGITAEIQENRILSEMVEEIGKKLNILGCINVEFLYDGNTYYLMDINPRFSAGIAFSQLCGYNFVLNNIKCFNKENIDVPVKVEQRIICKKFTEVCM